MFRPSHVRLTLALLLAAALGTAYHHSTEQAMTDAANAWLASLNVEQTAKAKLSFGQSASSNREQWHFVPGNNFEATYKYGRRGLTYGEMSPDQRHLADALLAASLSKTGFIKAKSIQSLEEILRIKEGDMTGRRDPSKYHFTIFGTPSKDGAWGWRIEGHHISLHFTLKGGKLISTTPTFFGANPQRIDIGTRKGFRALPHEEDMGFAFVNSLKPNQLSKAKVAEKAYKDILTSADTRAKLENQPTGLAASDMTDAQYKALLSLIGVYAHNVPAEIAAARMEAAKSTPKDKLFFAWAGATEPGVGDYYRVQAPEFLIEYDNVQNGANHTHTVWRDWDNDFGRDMLAEHRRLFHSSADAD